MTPPPEGEPPDRGGGVLPLVIAALLIWGGVQSCMAQRKQAERQRLMEVIRGQQQEADVRP